MSNDIIKGLKGNLDAAIADPKKDVKLEGVAKVGAPKMSKILTPEEIKASSARDTDVKVTLSRTMKIREGVNPVPINNGGNPETISDGSIKSKGEKFQLNTKTTRSIPAVDKKVEAPVAPKEDIIVIKGEAEKVEADKGVK